MTIHKCIFINISTFACRGSQSASSPVSSQHFFPQVLLLPFQATLSDVNCRSTRLVMKPFTSLIKDFSPTFYFWFMYMNFVVIFLWTYCSLVFLILMHLHTAVSFKKNRKGGFYKELSTVLMDILKIKLIPVKSEISIICDEFFLKKERKWLHYDL